MRRLWQGSACCLLTGLALAGCSGRPAPPPVLVGHIATLSGMDKRQGEQQARGIRLAIKEVDKGDALKVSVLHTDARGQLEAFEAEAVRLVAVNKVVALVGGNTAEELERLGRARAVVIGLTGARTRSMGELVFLAGLAPDIQGRLLAQAAAAAQPPAALGALGAGPLGVAAAIARGQVRPPSVAVLVDERQEACVQVAEAFGREWAARTASAPPVPWRYSKEPDYATVAGRVREAKTRAVLVAGDAEVVRQLRSRLPGLPMFYGGGEEGLAALRRHAETQDGVYLVTTFIADAPRAAEFAKQYQAAFHEEPGAEAALAFEAAGMLCEALRHTEAPHGKAELRQQLAALQRFSGLAGPLSVGPDRVVRRHLAVIRLENGRAVTVKRYDPPGG
jgi:ABC-type branched-subunit amino acid transport system substrate-binding protein